MMKAGGNAVTPAMRPAYNCTRHPSIPMRLPVRLPNDAATVERMMSWETGQQDPTGSPQGGSGKCEADELLRDGSPGRGILSANRWRGALKLQVY
jgi:hypothetical protein